MIRWVKENLLPFKVVNHDEEGVLLRRGRYIRTLDPGIYWIIPLIDEIRVIDIKSQLIDLPDKAITDRLTGETWTVSGTIEYSVDDPKKALLEVHDYDEAVQTLAVAIIAEKFVTDSIILSAIVLDALVDHADKEWGLRVTDFWINEFARCRVIKVVGVNL